MPIKRLTQLFILLCFIGLLMLWQVFTGYSDSSTVKKEKYLLKFNLNELTESEVRIIQQAGLPIVIMHRSKEDLKKLLAIRSHLLDPDSKNSRQPKYAKNYYRSLKPEFFIAYAVSPRTGRDIHYRLESFKTAYSDNNTDQWFGGFSAVNSNSLYDKAGRAYQQSDSSNLDIPNYKINASNILYVYTLKELDFD